MNDSTSNSVQNKGTIPKNNTYYIEGHEAITTADLPDADWWIDCGIDNSKSLFPKEYGMSLRGKKKKKVKR